MTRINCVPPSELCDKHLGAEYHELPRVVNLARNAFRNYDKKRMSSIPSQYTTGSGHVKFFYNKIGYIQRRYIEIVGECRKRGRRVHFADLDVAGIPDSFMNEWTPDEEDLARNRARLAERLVSMARGGTRP